MDIFSLSLVFLWLVNWDIDCFAMIALNFLYGEWAAARIEADEPATAASMKTVEIVKL